VTTIKPPLPDPTWPTVPFSIRSSAYGDQILAIQRAALAAADPGSAIRRWVWVDADRLVIAGRHYDLDGLDRLWVVGGGKAATAMVAALYALLGDRLEGGVVVTKYGYRDSRLDTGPVEVLEAGHPLPDEGGLAAAHRIAALLAGTRERDLVLAALSGGASALMVLPEDSLSLSDLRHATDLLLRSGATIAELNTVRKHLSRLKGGGLVRLASPALVVGLILSDVVGDPLESIASGPTAPDSTTFADAWAVLKWYDLVGRMPEAVSHRLQSGLEGRVPDTLKPEDLAWQRVQNVVVGSNRLAAEAAVETAQDLGFHALLLSTFVEGEAREVGRVAAALLRELVHYGRPVPQPACLVWGGETTVTVRGAGLGGRNQELALAAAQAIAGLPDVLLVALATDGTDGPTDAAGAVATGQTVERARCLGLDPTAYLADNNAYPFFEALHDLVCTGPTGTNVNDLLFLFALPRSLDPYEGGGP
jgi:glycerate 2-kinase